MRDPTYYAIISGPARWGIKLLYLWIAIRAVYYFWEAFNGISALSGVPLLIHSWWWIHVEFKRSVK
jgi:hypothetical protein